MKATKLLIWAALGVITGLLIENKALRVQRTKLSKALEKPSEPMEDNSGEGARRQQAGISL